MQKPKFRLFGGPNGSGKTHVFKKFKTLGYIHTEIYVNADRIEAQVKKVHKFSFNAYRVKVSKKDFIEHILDSTLFTTKLQDSNFIESFKLRSGTIYFAKDNSKINSYHASFIATYLAEKLLITQQSFAFETVMSHDSKLRMLEKAKAAGYKTYLYFIFTDSLKTNVARVQLRVLHGEHFVNEETIISRAARTFKLLPEAFNLADSAYIIDNSDQAKVIMGKEKNTLSQALHFPDIIKKYTQQIIKNFTGKISE